MLSHDPDNERDRSNITYMFLYIDEFWYGVMPSSYSQMSRERWGKLLVKGRIYDCT